MAHNNDEDERQTREDEAADTERDPACPQFLEADGDSE